MRRFGSMVLNGLAVLSAVLSLLVAISWVRSYWRYDEVFFANSDFSTAYIGGTPRGRLNLDIQRVEVPFRRITPTPHFGHDSSKPITAREPGHGFLGLGWDRRLIAPPNASSRTAVTVPHAYPVVLFAILPVIRICRWLRRRKILPAGHCRACGYDLRATPNRCPECGREQEAESRSPKFE